jgi:hypothetical protein
MRDNGEQVIGGTDRVAYLQLNTSAATNADLKDDL